MVRVTALLFAKYPGPGRVNTGTVLPLTPGEAAVLHEASLLAVCERVGGSDNLDVKVIVTPDERAFALGATGVLPLGAGQPDAADGLPFPCRCGAHGARDGTWPL